MGVGKTSVAGGTRDFEPAGGARRVWAAHAEPGWGGSRRATPCDAVRCGLRGVSFRTPVERGGAR